MNNVFPLKITSTPRSPSTRPSTTGNRRLCIAWKWVPKETSIYSQSIQPVLACVRLVRIPTPANVRGASATGCEILKNLVLPSVGEFTIIDDKIFTEADLGTNLFPNEESVGKSRAERTAALLEELNPDIKGAFMNNLLSSRPELFTPSTSPFTHIIIVSPFSTPDILQLSPEIPTFLVQTHPDSLTDLRLFNPWEELTALAVEKTKGVDKPASEGEWTTMSTDMFHTWRTSGPLSMPSGSSMTSLNKVLGYFPYPGGLGSITLEEVSLFTKHSDFIRRINYRPLSPEYSPLNIRHKQTVIGALNDWNSEESLVHDYIAICAFQEYYSTMGRFPARKTRTQIKTKKRSKPL
ncbi:hypothetical protein BZA77DRAFT_353409 [Pyronema omphalodes]|nr:hypothetical protein BZA77DRAFT_353409 [Pyronema omphalodes]